MEMNLKKLSVTALSLTLSLGLLAGCSGKPAVSTGSPAPSPVSYTHLPGAV